MALSWANAVPLTPACTGEYRGVVTQSLTHDGADRGRDGGSLKSFDQTSPLTDMRQEASPRAEASVEDVYRDHAPRLWRAVLGYAGDPDVASEAVAEAFAQLIARQKRAPVDSPAGWVWTAAFRIAAGLLQRSAQLPVEDQSAYELPEPVVDLVRTLARLPERHAEQPPRHRRPARHAAGDRPEAA